MHVDYRLFRNRRQKKGELTKAIKMGISSLFDFFRKKDKSHWEKIYTSRAPHKLGWYQEHPEVSLRLIRETGLGSNAPIIDVGGGASRLAGALLQEGYHNLTVFDISARALYTAKQLLACEAEKVTWIEGDITSYVFNQQYDIWHDRAVFHFLTEAEDRQKYLQSLNRTLSADGHLIIAAFSPEAPPKCSGLPVVRYSPETLQKEIGLGFELISSMDEFHRTPANTEQKFIYCHFRRAA